MNRLKYIAVIAFLGIVGFSELGAQIKEEQLILNRKREPEVKKIDKKKTSVQQEKNYPPENKKKEDSLNLKYNIVNVPPVSDFKTTEIQGEDISPKFSSDYQSNFFRIGYGNYGKFLADANVSGKIEENVEVGIDVNYLSTNGLKNDYDWNSKQSRANVSAFSNIFTESGKYNLDVNYDMSNFNYYGIYAIKPISNDIDLQQKISKFSVNGNYDHYSNEIINDIRFKSYFLKDHFSAKETFADLEANFSYHNYELKNGIVANGDLGARLESVNSTFDILDKHSNNQLNFNLSPKVTFYRGESYLSIGSDISFLNYKYSNLNIEEKGNKLYWFPKVEVLYAADNGLNFYGGVDGGLQMNTYGNLTDENPYLLSDLLLIPTEKKYNIYLGLKGDLNQLIKYDISAGYSKLNNIQFFVNNDLLDSDINANRFAYDYANTFSTIYDNGTLTEIKATAQYFPMADLTVDAGLHFKKYSLDSLSEAYYKPAVELNLGAKYTMLDKKLSLGLKGFLVSERKTNAYEIFPDNNNPLIYISIEDKGASIAGYMDFNLSAEYKIHNNFSIFALGNNLLNTKYQRFVGYKVLGTQLLAGVKITF